MAIGGSLADVGLADICQLLSLTFKTGCLTLTDRSDFGYVYFDSGRVTYATVLNQPDRLGELLVKNGVVQPEDLAQAVEEQEEESGRRLGEILIHRGILDREELEKWISVQVQEAVYHLLTWTQGTFHFNPDERPEEDQSLSESLGADSLLIEGARRVDEWVMIEEKISSLDLIFELARDPRSVEGLELSGNQKRLLPLLDGDRTVRDLVSESGLVEFETGKALYELLQAGFIQRVGERSPEGPKEDEAAAHRSLRLGLAFYKAGMLEDSTRELEATLGLDPNEATARFHLAVIHLREGNPEEAVEHFEAIPADRAEAYEVLRNRALALEALGRFDEALSVLKKAEAGQSGDPDLALARGITELKSGNPKAARTTFLGYRRKMDKAHPPPIFYAFSVLAAASCGEMEEAVALGREGLNIYPDEAAVLVNTGSVLDYRGDHEAAEQYFMRALNPGSDTLPQAHKNLGDQAYRRGDLPTARSHYEAAVVLNPDLGDDVFLKLGSIAADADDPDLAIMLLRRAVDLNPDNESARARLAQLSALP